ncbi:hypothetical protein GBAR_LOCUS18086 [Geodia barretti]|uniref:Uncharacterized protein n=1 Tax=Geodia barretti TaxID=519541 RepID=A0AA35SLT3_GEOBA|nr:hypothetical protein GBAR_LOCUS18086 [Geodia barretti]
MVQRTGRSALHFSAEEGDSATTEALLKAGANPHHKDKNGATAMEITEQRAQSSLVSKTLPMREMMTQPSLYASQLSLRHRRQRRSEIKYLKGGKAMRATSRYDSQYGVTAMELAPLVSQSVREMMTTLPSRFASQRAVRRLKSESKDLEGDDTSSMLKLEGQELESEGRDPTAGQQSQVRKKMTPEMDPEHSPDFDL